MSDRLIHRPRHIHQVIDQSRRQIRLIRLSKDLDTYRDICCHTSVHDLDNAPDFKAISYEWGSAWPPRYIMVDDHLLAISENLWHFLEIFRQNPDDVWLWIDQVSIDQSNQLERNHQVRMMGSIYSAAVRVIAWLGNPSAQELRSLESVLDQSEFDDESLLPVAFIFRYGYWTRLWIIQELILPRNVVFQIGMIWLQLSTLRSIYYVLDISEFCPVDRRIWFHIAYLVRNYDASSRFPQSLVSRNNDASSISPQSLVLVLARLGRSGQCSEPRDRIFELLGLVDGSDHVQIDYNMPTETLLDGVLEKVIYGSRVIESRHELKRLADALSILSRELNLSHQWMVWFGGEYLEIEPTFRFLYFINSPWAAALDISKWSVEQLIAIFREARDMFPPSKTWEWGLARDTYTDYRRLNDWVESLNSSDPSLLHLQYFRTLDNRNGDLYQQSAAIPWNFRSLLEEREQETIIRS